MQKRYDLSAKDTMDKDTISSGKEQKLLSAVEVEKFFSDLESYDTKSGDISQAPDSAAAVSAFSTATSQQEQEQQPGHVREVPQLVALLLSKDRIPSGGGKKVSKDEGEHSNRTSYATVQLPDRSSVRSHVFYRCNMCKLTFTYSEELLRHKSNCNKRPHKCDICQNLCASKAFLERHLRSHSNKKPLCEICHIEFQNNSALKRHKIIFHEKTNADGKTESHTCEICQMSFTHRGGLLTHKPKCDGKPYKCRICQKRFKQKVELESHLVVHSNDKPHQCQICSKTFKRKHDLYYHKRHKHTEKNDLSISAVRISVQRRSQSHGSRECDQDERPYKCEKCEQKYKSKASLKRHETAHLRDLPM